MPPSKRDIREQQEQDAIARERLVDPDAPAPPPVPRDAAAVAKAEAKRVRKGERRLREGDDA